MLDSGPLITLYDPDDDRAKSVKTILRKAQADKYPAFITPLTIAETHGRILYDHGYARALKFLHKVTDGSIHVVDLQGQDFMKAIEIIARFPDQEISFCDSVTMAVMGRVGIRKVLTYDRHFGILNYTCISGL